MSRQYICVKPPTFLSHLGLSYYWLHSSTCNVRKRGLVHQPSSFMSWPPGFHGFIAEYLMCAVRLIHRFHLTLRKCPLAACMKVCNCLGNNLQEFPWLLLRSIDFDSFLPIGQELYMPWINFTHGSWPLRWQIPRIYGKWSQMNWSNWKDQSQEHIWSTLSFKHVSKMVASMDRCCWSFWSILAFV